jgi:GNAT superfamily N-acetyltransferase
MATVTIYHLELPSRAVFHPSEQRPRYQLEQVTAPAAAFLRFLYVATGTDWHWVDRLEWTDEQWLARQAQPGIEIWGAIEAGAPLGYFELARLSDGETVELVYFGLLPHAVGTGQGGVLLSAAVERAWEMGASRVYVNTCTLDHPRALENYQRRGFKLLRKETRKRIVD